MALDFRLLEAIDDWDDRSPGNAVTTVEELAAELKEEPVRISKALVRLVESGQVTAAKVTHMGSPYAEYHVRGITSSGKFQVDRVRSGFPALTGGSPPATAAGPPSVVINMSGGTIGSVTGQVIGNIKNNLASATGESAEEFRHAMVALIEAVGKDAGMTATEKTEAIEALEVLAASAALPEDKRKIGVIKAVLMGLAASLATANEAHLAWSTYAPAIAKLFGV